MNIFFILLKKELKSFFVGPVAYVFLVIFLLMQGVLTFYFGDFLQQGQADLKLFFSYIPWLYLLFIPALTMGCWVKEKQGGTLETLLTLPLTYTKLVLAKFFASWAMIGLFLLGTFPIWITVSYLGAPDHNVIIFGYLSCFLLAGAYIGLGLCFSSLTKNEVVAYVFTVISLLFFLFNGIDFFEKFFTKLFPELLVFILHSFSFSYHFNNMIKGLIYLKDIIFFSSFILFFLFANIICLEQKKEI